MALGAGKYDDLCTYVREQAEADGAIIIIINGNKGQGFSAQANLGVTAALPALLEHIAKQMRETMSQDAPEDAKEE